MFFEQMVQLAVPIVLTFVVYFGVWTLIAHRKGFETGPQQPILSIPRRTHTISGIEQADLFMTIDDAV